MSTTVTGPRPCQNPDCGRMVPAPILYCCGTCCSSGHLLVFRHEDACNVRSGSTDWTVAYRFYGPAPTSTLPEPQLQENPRA